MSLYTRELNIKLHQHLIDVAKDVREMFDENNVGHMELEITISGRVHDEMKIEYGLREQYDPQVQGGTLDAVVEEYFRRRGWKKKNAPLALVGPALKPVVTNDETVE